jgi:hypothetical protein
MFIPVVAAVLAMLSFMAAAGSTVAAASGSNTVYVAPGGTAGNSDNSCESAGYSTIQSAVNASAAGGTVVVCPGSYNEQVTIATSGLTLRGFGAASVIAPTTATPSSVVDSDGYTDVPVVYVDPGKSGVTLQNLTVDGSGLEANPQVFCSDDLVGVLFDGAAGTMNTVSVLHTNTNSGCGTGLGVEALGGSALTIVRSTVSDYNKNGITCNDVGTSCSLQQDTTTGSGPNNQLAQNGIQIGFGATATLDHNVASSNDYTGTTNATEPQADYAAGILLYGAGATSIDHSNLANDQIAIEIVDTNATADHTTITEDSPGIANSVGVFDVPCDYYCSFFTSTSGTPGTMQLSLDHTQITFAGSPSGSYGIWIGDAWGNDDPYGSSGTVVANVQHSQISGATYPVVYGPRAS